MPGKKAKGGKPNQFAALIQGALVNTFLGRAAVESPPSARQQVSEMRFWCLGGVQWFGAYFPCLWYGHVSHAASGVDEAPRGGEQNRSNLCGGGHGFYAAMVRWCVSSHAAAWAAWVINLVLPKPSHPESCMPHASAKAQRCQWDKHPARMEVQAIQSIQLCKTRARKWWWRFARSVVPTCFRCAAAGFARKNITDSSTSTGNASSTPSFLDHCAKLPRLWKGACLSFIDLSPETNVSPFVPWQAIDNWFQTPQEVHGRNLQPQSVNLPNVKEVVVLTSRYYRGHSLRQSSIIWVLEKIWNQRGQYVVRFCMNCPLFVSSIPCLAFLILWVCSPSPLFEAVTKFIVVNASPASGIISSKTVKISQSQPPKVWSPSYPPCCCFHAYFNR